MPYNPKKNGAANYKSWMQLTAAQISTIEALEGADNTANPNAERFAQMVHVVNGITIDASDIQLGAVELKDFSTDTRATIVDAGSVTALYTELIDSSGNTLDNIKTYGTYDTNNYQNVDGTVSGSVSSALSVDSLYRVKAYTADCWIKIGSNPSPADFEGMLLTQYDELTLQVNDGDKIGVIGGMINIVPVG